MSEVSEQHWPGVDPAAQALLHWISVFIPFIALTEDNQKVQPSPSFKSVTYFNGFNLMSDFRGWVFVVYCTALSIPGCFDVFLHLSKVIL